MSSCGSPMRKNELVRLQKSRTMCCAYRGAPSEHETGTCIVTMQHGDEQESCMVYQAEYPPQGNCRSVIQALIMAKNVHEQDVGSHKVGSHHRVHGGLRSHTREELTVLWRAWSEHDWPALW